MKGLLIILALVLSASIHAIPSKVSAEYMSESTWFLYRDDFRKGSPVVAEIRFKNDLTILTQAEYSESLFSIEGKYSVEADGVTIDFRPIFGHQDDARAKLKEASPKTATCKINLIENSLVYRSKMNCSNGFIFYKKSDTLPAGRTVLFDNVHVITLGIKQVKAKHNATLRTGPSTDFKSVRYGEELCGLEHPHLPAGSSVTLYARTLQKQTIENRKYYWYLVDVQDYCRPGFVWVYGDALVLKDIE